MSAMLRTKMFWVFAFLVLGMSLGRQAAHAAVATVTVTSPGTLTTDSRPTITVTVSGTSGADTLTLSLLDGGGGAVVNGAVLTSTGTSANNVDTVPGNGTYTFTTAHIDTPGSYRLRAVIAGADTGTGSSTAFTVNAGIPATVGITTNPTPVNVTADNTFALGVTVNDADGNPVTDGTGVALAVSPAPAVASTGTAATTTVGAASFPAVRIKSAGSYTVTAVSGGISSSANATLAQRSTAVTVTAGAATHLTVTAPGTASSNTAISVAVTARDQFENTATGYAGSVHFSSTDSAAILPGNTGLAGGAGTFPATLRTAGSQTITATDTVTAGITGTTGTITVAAGASASLSFTQSPGNAAVGATLSTTRVLVLDAAGNPKSGVTVTLSLAGPAATLGGTVSQATNGSGLATFNDLTVDATGIFQLVGSTPGAGGTTLTGSSTIFVVTAGAAAQLAFGQQPASTVAGVALSPSVTVAIEDAGGNVVTSSSANVTLSIDPGFNPGGSTLSGTVTRAAVSGVATFNNLSLNKTGTGYKLDAAATALTGAVSTTFNITPGPASTVTLALPSPATGLTTDSTFNLTALVRDSQGNPVIDGTLVTLALSSGGGPGVVLTGGTANTSGGTATFSVSINKAGTYKFKATSGGITSAETGPLVISAGAAATLTFVRQPGNTGAGLPITPAVTVLARDVNGNVVPAAAITLALAGTSSAGGVAALTGTTSNPDGTVTQTTDGTGVATFSDLSVSQVGTAYTLTASAGTGAAVTSTAFAVTAGAAAAITLSLSNPPTPLTTDRFFTVAAAVSDAQGYPVVDGTVVTLSLTNGDGTPVTNGAALTGGTASTSGGTATFSINISKVGSYKITAASGTATAATPLGPVTISAGAVATVTFVQQPTSTAAAVAMTPAVTVLAKDANANVVPNASISLVLAGTPTAGGAVTLSGTTRNPTDGTVTQTTTSTGVATFSDLSVNKVGTAYTLAASTGAAPAVTSSSFAITPGPITLAVTAQPPTSTVSGSAFSVSISLLDGSSNPIPNAPVTLTLSQGAGTLSGNVTQNTDAAGLITFSGLSIDRAGADKQLTATATVTTNTLPQSYTAVTAPVFAITPGVAATLSFTAQPPGVITDPNTPFSVAVQALDAGGNLVADAPTTTITLSLSGSGAATLSGGAAQSTVSGVSPFASLKVSAPGTYQLTAAARTTGATTSATPVVSTSFTVGNPPAGITRLTTDVGIVHAGDPAFTLTLVGTGFVPGAVVTFGGSASVLPDPTATPLVTNVSVSSDGTQITATIAAGLVARAGSPAVTVINPGTAAANAGTLNFLVYPLGPVADTAGSPHADPAVQYLNPGMQLFSVPFDYKADADGAALRVSDILHTFSINPAALTLADLSLTGAAVPATLAVWDPVTAGYVLTTGADVPVFQHGITADSLVLGQGYWGRFQFHPAADPTRQAGLAVRGLAAGDLTDGRKLNGQTFAIALQPGWNMIGDPFTGAVNLSLIQVQPLDGSGNPLGQAVSLTQASDAGLVSNFFYKYVPGTGPGTGYVPVTPAGVLLPGGAPASSDNKLNPYVGYWVFTYQACQLLIPAP